MEVALSPAVCDHSNVSMRPLIPQNLWITPPRQRPRADSFWLFLFVEVCGGPLLLLPGARAFSRVLAERVGQRGNPARPREKPPALPVAPGDKRTLTTRRAAADPQRRQLVGWPRTHDRRSARSFLDRTKCLLMPYRGASGWGWANSDHREQGLAVRRHAGLRHAHHQDQRGARQPRAARHGVR